MSIFFFKKCLRFDIVIILGVLCGSVADLSDCSSGTARMLSDVDELCARNGVGGIYGQLVTLGYKVCKNYSALYVINPLHC